MFSFTIMAIGYFSPLSIESKLDTHFLCDLLRWSINQRITWCSRICKNVSFLKIKEINNSTYTFSGIYEKTILYHTVSFKNIDIYIWFTKYYNIILLASKYCVKWHTVYVVFDEMLSTNGSKKLSILALQAHSAK